MTETITITPEIGCIAEISIKTTTEEEETIVTEVRIEIICPITETAVGPGIETTTEMIIGMTIDQITEGMKAIKDITVGLKILVDLGTEIEEIEAAPGRVPNPGVVPKTDMGIEGKVGITTEIGTGLSLDQDHLLELVPTNTEVDVTDAMSTIILPENVLMYTSGRKFQ